MLSLICSGLNAERLAAKKPALETKNLMKEGGLIVEQCLITADGVRLPYPLCSIETEKLATVKQIQTLIDNRLIRRENHEDGDHFELVHNRLAQVALQRRLASEQHKKALRQQQIQRR